MKRNLSARYTLHQCLYSGAVAGVMTFATAYLLYKGFPPGKVGTLMACGTILSCITQPLLASVADKAPKPILPQLSALLTAGCMGLLLLMLFGGLSEGIFPIAYLALVWLFDSMNGLLNSISVYYNSNGCRINYGVGRGIGSVVYSVFALIIGKVMELYGADSMLKVVLVLMPFLFVLILGYPRIQPAEPAAKQQEHSDEQPCSIPEFFRKYRCFCIFLAGVLFLAMFHVMVENYLIAIMERLGGNSSHVGVALSVATISSVVVFCFFERIRTAVGDIRLMKATGFFFILKSVLLIIAPSIGFVYGVQLLQTLTYAILSPVQVYYANRRVAAADMVKGQAFIAAAYTLGCAGGNFFGGQFMQLWGIETLLNAGVVFAVTGTVILLLTADRKDVEMA